METKNMAMQKMQVGIVLIVGIVGVAATVLAATLLTAYQQINNTGIVKAIGVGVYEDAGCTKNVTSINWGVLYPDTNASFTVYIKNEGNIPMTLNMTISNWNPTQAAQYITLNWNREDYVLGAKSVIQANLNLSVSPNIAEITNFQFDIIIIGIENA
ncbi:hypothetical protein KEJ15_04615 [Candidatus Bathyarchaeota archaeon]|nr:hypothetical protein [Candidatus Bathyarchaeota archaeon]